MGAVSGFVLAAPNEPTLYIAGDTICCDEVAAALASAQPEVVVLNAGAAQFLASGPITMTAADVITVARAAPGAQIIAVHMEAVNHCRLGRAALHDALVAAGQAARVAIREDGEWLRLARAPD